MVSVFPPVQVPLAEIECSYVRSSGPGGQNVNKVNSKCVLRWNVLASPSLSISVRARFIEAFRTRLTKEGEIVLMSDRFRDQKRNYDDCLEKLGAMLQSVARPPKTRTKTKPTRGSERRREAGKKAQSDKKAQRRGKWD